MASRLGNRRRILIDSYLSRKTASLLRESGIDREIEKALELMFADSFESGRRAGMDLEKWHSGTSEVTRCIPKSMASDGILTMVVCRDGDMAIDTYSIPLRKFMNGECQAWKYVEAPRIENIRQELA